MSESDHGNNPTVVHMTSHLLRSLYLATSINHVELINSTTNEYDGIHIVGAPRDTDVCADAHHVVMPRDINVCADTHHVATTNTGKSDSPQYNCPSCPSYFVYIIISSNRSQCPCPHVTTDDSRQCSHDHSSTYNNSKYSSAPLLTNGVAPTCHVMLPCRDPGSAYGRNPGSRTERINHNYEIRVGGMQMT